MDKNTNIKTVIVSVPICHFGISDENMEQYDKLFSEIEIVINCIPELLSGSQEDKSLE